MNGQDRRDSLVGFNILEAEAFRIAKDHGFHDEPNPLPQSLALIHSEISEALEAYRDDDMFSVTPEGKPEGIVSELADAIIRILDTAHELAPGLLGSVLVAKMEYNERRPHRHGRVRL